MVKARNPSGLPKIGVPPVKIAQIRPSISIPPASARTIPDIMLRSVDFPAPFSPESPCTSPACTVSETPKGCAVRCGKGRDIVLCHQPLRRCHHTRQSLPRHQPQPHVHRHLAGQHRKAIDRSGQIARPHHGVSVRIPVRFEHGKLFSLARRVERLLAAPVRRNGCHDLGLARHRDGFGKARRLLACRTDPPSGRLARGGANAAQTGQAPNPRHRIGSTSTD